MMRIVLFIKKYSSCIRPGQDNFSAFGFFSSICLFFTLTGTGIFFLPYSLDAQNKKGKSSAPSKKTVKKKQAIELLRSSETEYLTFEQGKEKVVIFRGGVMLKFKDIILQAETIKFNPNTGEIFGEGNVKWIEPQKKVTGDYFFFDNEKQNGVVFEGKTDIKPIYYHGGSFHLLKKDHFLVNLAFFTTCDLEYPHYSFQAKRVWIYPDNKLVALHLLYQVSDVPIFYWPLVFQTDLGTGVLTFYGKNQEKGHYLQNTYYFLLPSLQEQPFLPDQGKVFFDYYQHTGELYGLFFSRESSNINYHVDLELANFRRRDQICDVIFSNEDSSCNEITTNFFLSPDGTLSEESQLWWKVDTKLSAQWSTKNDIHSHVSLELTDLRHRNFEPEFGHRNEPLETFNIVSFGPIFKNSGPNELKWRAEYNLSTTSTYFNILFERRLRWNQLSNESESRYLPSFDLAPSLRFSTRQQILEPQKRFFSGSWIIFNTNGSLTRTLTEGALDRLIYQGSGEIKNLYQFSLWSWFRVDPSLTYGLRYHTTSPQTDDLEKESKRLRFHYLVSKTPVRIGKNPLYFQVEHEYGYYFFRAFQDPIFKNQGLHFLNFLLKSDLYPFFLLSADTKRDLRRYPHALPEHFRWSPLKLFLELRYDFFTEKAQKKRLGKDFSLYTSLDSTYRYLIRYQRSGTNEAYLNWGLKNAKTGLIDKLNDLSLSFGWYHDFINPKQDDLTLKFNLDVQIISDLRLIWEVNSRADEVDRYTQDKNFFEDIINGFNFFRPQSTNDTIFNLNFMRVVLEHQLHKWVFRVYYERFRRTIFWGSNLENRASFYEQSVYISLTLTEFDFLPSEKVEVYRKNPGDDF